MSTRLSRVLRQSNTEFDRAIMFVCPGCTHIHRMTIEAKPGYTGPCWQWDGNVDAPTLSPSLLVFSPEHERDGERVPYRVLCHSFIRAGFIDFLGDSTEHQLRGSYPLPDFPHDRWSNDGDNWQPPAKRMWRAARA